MVPREGPPRPRFRPRRCRPWSAIVVVDYQYLLVHPGPVLVENSVVHGVSRLPGAGRIAVAARAEGSALVVTVQDNGPGPFATPKQRGAGIGITNLRQRLERLYGNAATMEIAEATGGGCLATISLPLRAAPLAV